MRVSRAGGISLTSGTFPPVQDGRDDVILVDAGGTLAAHPPRAVVAGSPCHRASAPSTPCSLGTYLPSSGRSSITRHRAGPGKHRQIRSVGAGG